MKRLVIARRCSQILFFMLFIAILIPVAGVLTDILPVRSLFHSSPLMVIRLSLSSKGVAAGAGYAVLMLCLTAIFGRFFCGWICPMGTLIDIAGIPGKGRICFSEKVNSRISKIKYLTLAVFMAAAFFAPRTVGLGDPMAMTARAMLMNVFPALMSFYNEGTYIFSPDPVFFRYIAVILASVLISRAWCRVLCPLGALYAAVSRIAPLKRVSSGCSSCDSCRSICRMGAIKANGSEYTASECILCMDCVYCCPGNRVKFTFKK